MSLIGLPETWRFSIWNNLGSAISNAPVGLPTVTGRRVRFDANGALSYEAAVFSFFGPGAAASLANNGFLTGPTWSNTASLYLTGDFQFSAFASGGLSGTLALYLEISPDGGTTWPTPTSANALGGGQLLVGMGFASTTTNSTASTTQRIDFTI